MGGSTTIHDNSIPRTRCAQLDSNQMERQTRPTGPGIGRGMGRGLPLPPPVLPAIRRSSRERAPSSRLPSGHTLQLTGNIFLCSRLIFPSLQTVAVNVELNVPSPPQQFEIITWNAAENFKLTFFLLLLFCFHMHRSIFFLGSAPSIPCSLFISTLTAYSYSTCIYDGTGCWMSGSDSIQTSFSLKGLVMGPQDHSRNVSRSPHL